MEFRPIKHQIERATRQSSIHDLETVNIDGRLKLGIFCMEVGPES